MTEDAPPNVHFCTESRILGDGLEEQLRQFLTEHPDTSLVIIDTLQMIRGTTYDNTCANDYRDLSALKRLADAHGIAILLIHHLRKEKANDVFNRISGTTAISGAVDASFTLVEEQRGSGKAPLSCIGRDIEYRELELRRNADNVWEVAADSYQRPELLGDRIIVLISELLRSHSEFIGTPTELAQHIDPDGSEGVTYGTCADEGERTLMQKKRTTIVTARMTPEVKQQLQARARDANMTLTNYLIICGLGQEIVRIDGLDNLLSELKAQGRNLNQLTTLSG